MINKENICRQTIEIVKKAGAYICDELEKKEHLEVEEKGEHNFVTHVDKTAEKILVDGLSGLVSGAGFITEEGTENSRGKEYNWIIDPLDGTTNFIHGVYPFAVSVALAKDHEPVVGVILELGFNEVFYAWKGGGAWMNDKPVKASHRKTLHESLIATGFPYTNYRYTDQFMKTIDWFMKNSRGLRRLGSAATDIAYVACGRYDGFYEYGLNPWDVAAGILILEEAGGKAADFNGGRDFIFGEEVICSNGKNHEEFVHTVKTIMKQQ